MKSKVVYLTSNGFDSPLRGIRWSKRFLNELDEIMPLEVFDNVIHMRIDLIQTPELFSKDEQNPTLSVLYLNESEERSKLKVLFNFDDEIVTLVSVRK